MEAWHLRGIEGLLAIFAAGTPLQRKDEVLHVEDLF